MRITGWFDLGDAGFSLFTGMMLVSTTAVVLAGLIGLALRRRASARHAVWLCALAVVLLSPALAWMGRRARPGPDRLASVRRDGRIDGHPARTSAFSSGGDAAELHRRARRLGSRPLFPGRDRA